MFTGAAANGTVVGAAKGALIGSGVGIPAAFATDFAAGSIGNALEQQITTGRVDLGESLRSGAGNALSELLYGTGKLKGAGDAFIRGARTDAVMAGFKNISDTAGAYGVAGSRLFTPKSNGANILGVSGAGRDPKGMCGSPDPFELGEGLGGRKGYHSGSRHGMAGDGSGFSLGGFVKDVLTGAVTGGLGSAGFYGAGKAVEALRGSVDGRRDTGIFGNGRKVRYREGRIIDPIVVTYDMRLNPEEYAYAIVDKYGINLRGSGQKISIILKLRT